MRDFENRLKGGHPNSLGNTLEVVNEVLEDPTLFDELFNCYFSHNEIVRLRVSNAMKRVAQGQYEVLLPYLDRFIHEIALIDQPSAKWTLAQLFSMYDKDLTPNQLAEAKGIVKHNLINEKDWIVLNHSMETLGKWSIADSELKKWLTPYLKQLARDQRKSVSKRAHKLLAQLAT